jgi:hypothetical protein
LACNCFVGSEDRRRGVKQVVGLDAETKAMNAATLWKRTGQDICEQPPALLVTQKQISG